MSAARSWRPGRRAKVLVVDDDQSTCELLAQYLDDPNLELHWELDAEDALGRIRSDVWDVVLADVHMEPMGGFDLCRQILSIAPNLPVVVVTGDNSLDAAVGAIRAGAYDFILKPLDKKTLSLSVWRAVHHSQLKDQLTALRQERWEASSQCGMVGRSRSIAKIADLIQRVAATDATVLVTGPSGTGKELAARAIHDHSARADGPFVAVNCAAVPENLLESALFGHVKGAFTDASRDNTGLFVEANGGTLFLDEVGEMPIALQPKLLRALQERRVRPVGANKEVPFDARVVAATNRPLRNEVAAGRFREDLYYRLNVVEVEMPSLAERRGDILLLAQFFLERCAARYKKDVHGISPPAAKRLLAYDWPGNVRELENVIERAVALTRFDHITGEDLPTELGGSISRSQRAEMIDGELEEPVNLAELERRYVLKVLGLMEGNKSRAARVLGLDRRTLYRKLEAWGVSDGKDEEILQAEEGGTPSDPLDDDGVRDDDEERDDDVRDDDVRDDDVRDDDVRDDEDDLDDASVAPASSDAAL